jgi:hypothetical protein
MEGFTVLHREFWKPWIVWPLFGWPWPSFFSLGVIGRVKAAMEEMTGTEKIAGRWVRI